MREASSHPSHAQQASPGGADNARLADSAMEESKDEPTRESESAVKTKRVFDRRNALVKDGYYICNTCKEPVCKATKKTNRNLFQFFSIGAHKDCKEQPFLKPK